MTLNQHAQPSAVDGVRQQQRSINASQEAKNSKEKCCSAAGAYWGLHTHAHALIKFIITVGIEMQQ